MSPHEFKYSLLKLVNKNDPRLISETVIARSLAAKYIDASEGARLDCSRMLHEDLATLETP